MKGKKFLLALLVFALMFVMVVGCSGGSSNESNGDTETTEPAEQEQGTDETAAEEETDAKPSWQTENITLKYASWEDEAVEAEMLKAFMEKYPNIKVESDASINWPWNDSLATAASAGNLPDVMVLENVAVGAQNDWFYNIEPFFEADPETQKIFPNMRERGVYGGKRLASPTWMAVMGVFVNKTLFEKNNVPLPSYNWTIDEMVELAKTLSNPEEHYYGIDGPWGNLAFEDYWPMQYDRNLSWSAYDGQKFTFASNEQWLRGYETKVEFRRLKIEENMTAEEKKEVFGDENAWGFQKGHVAMGIDGAWNIGWLPDEMKKSGAGELDFYPYPGGTAGQRLPVLADFAAVSSTTQHPEAAYELMKFMSWSKEGVLKRIEVYEKLGKSVSDMFPIIDEPEVWDLLKSKALYPGVKAIMDLIPQAVPDNGKDLPGMTEFSNWYWEQKIPEKIDSGEFTPADKAQEIEDKMNEFMQQGLDAFAQ